jgi:peroxiredoxin
MGRLEKASNVAILVMAVVVIGKFAVDAFHRTSKPAEPYAHGDTIKDTPHLKLVAAPLTLLMVTTSHCGYCTASMPYFEALTAAAGKAGTRVVAVTSEEPATNGQYLSEHKVRFDAVVSAKDNSIRYRGTPTVIVVDHDGKVQRAWTGKLNGDREAEILAAITSN